MTVDEIRSLRNAEPFRPFTLELKDGRRFFIEAHYYVAISPKQDFVLAVSRNAGTAWFAPEQVKKVRLLPKAVG